MNIDSEELRAQVNALPWFHQLDFGNGILSPGVIKLPKLRRAFRYMFDIPVEGRSVIDIGCWDGAASIEAVRRGARRVLATDHHAWYHWNRRPSFDLARKHLAPSIEVKDIDVPDISVETVGTFDIVIFSGVFYHLRHPLLALERIAPIATECLILETHLIQSLSRKPYMRFYPGTELGNDPTNWWGPNRACIEAMLRDVGFKRIRFRRHDYRWRRGMFHAWR